MKGTPGSAATTGLGGGGGGCDSVAPAALAAAGNEARGSRSGADGGCFGACFAESGKAQKAAAQARRKVAKKSKSRKVHTTVSFHRPKTQIRARKPAYPRKSVPSMERLDQFQVLKHPLTTESAMKKIEENNTLVFIVDVRADKAKIRRAVKEMYDIQCKKINTLVRPTGDKKAFVKLAADHDALDVANKIGII